MECKINYIIIFYTWNKSCIHIRNEYKVAHVKPEVNFTGKHRGNRKSKLHTDVSKHRISQSFLWVPWTSTQLSFTVLVNGILHKRASDCCLTPNTKCTVFFSYMRTSYDTSTLTITPMMRFIYILSINWVLYSIHVLRILSQGMDRSTKTRYSIHF